MNLFVQMMSVTLQSLLQFVQSLAHSTIQTFDSGKQHKTAWMCNRYILQSARVKPQQITEEKRKNVIYEHVYCVLMAARLYVIIKPI